MLNPAPRGAVTYKSRAKQERDFTGLRYGNITPTDIDGAFDYHNKCFVFFEAKHINAPPMLDGQRLFLERLCDNLRKPAIVITFSHSYPVDQAIDFAVCMVDSIRFNGKWHPITRKITVAEMQSRFLERFGK